MPIDNRVFEPYTMEFNSPLTDEDWEKLEDVDFDHTEHIWFHTKHGKEVHFYKNAIPIEWILKWACEFIDPNSEGYKMAMELVHDWRKENEHKESD